LQVLYAAVSVDELKAPISVSRERPVAGILPWVRMLALALACSFLAACEENTRTGFQGYAEGEYVRVAASFGGRLERLNVRRGENVQMGAALFALENENEAAARLEAEQRLRAAEAQLANLQKGRRPTELAAIEAQLDQARAAMRLAEAQLRRSEKLVAQNFISKERLDEARTAYERSRAVVEQLQADLATAKLAARQDEIRGAQASVQAAKAALAQAEWRLEQKSVHAPVAGLVADTLFVKGEWVPAGAPVVSMLPPENILLRFFVPEVQLGAIRLGQRVVVTCDGCPGPVVARVSFIATRAEFTPPVIYSRENRAKLVFLVEARPAPEDAVKLHPGQPIDVRLDQP
jgi:HlyD family secretion protein